jgi:hypothetical protein
MCFYKENQLYSKRNPGKSAQGEKTSSPEVSLPEKSDTDDAYIEDVLVKKKKLLDEKAPGLFEHLAKLSSDEPSTENSSETNFDQEVGETKQYVIISNSARIFKHQGDCDLSNIIKFRPQYNNTNLFQIPALECFRVQNEPVRNNLFEDMQRKKLLTLMNENTLMLNNVMASQEKSQNELIMCLEELKSFKNEISESSKSQLEKIELLKEQKKKSAQFDSNPTPLALSNYFFGNGQIYRYELELQNEIPSPIFRERNLIINLRLVNILTKEVVRNQNKIVVHLSLHTWEVPSNPITRNKSGNKAVMGDTEVELVDGEATFDRIQINEVTSKFIHGHVAMIIVPAKPSNIGTSLGEQDDGEDYIDFESIKPLMLEKVTVKSKKKNPKKKDD